MRVQFTIDDASGHELQLKASSLGLSVSSYVRHLIKKSFKNKKPNLLEQGIEDIKNGRVEEISLEDFYKQLESLE